MEPKKFATFEDAWQAHFEALPSHERLEILSHPKGERAVRHAKEALLASDDGDEAVKDFLTRCPGSSGSPKA